MIKQLVSGNNEIEEGETDRQQIRSRLNHSKNNQTVYYEDQSQLAIKIDTGNDNERATPEAEFEHSRASDHRPREGLLSIFGSQKRRTVAPPQSNSSPKQPSSHKKSPVVQKPSPVRLRPSFKLNLVVENQKQAVEQLSARPFYNSKRLSNNVNLPVTP